MEEDTVRLGDPRGPVAEQALNVFREAPLILAADRRAAGLDALLRAVLEALPAALFGAHHVAVQRLVRACDRVLEERRREVAATREDDQPGEGPSGMEAAVGECRPPDDQGLAPADGKPRLRRRRGRGRGGGGRPVQGCTRQRIIRNHEQIVVVVVVFIIVVIIVFVALVILRPRRSRLPEP